MGVFTKEEIVEGLKKSVEAGDEKEILGWIEELDADVQFKLKLFDLVLAKEYWKVYAEVVEYVDRY